MKPQRSRRLPREAGILAVWVAIMIVFSSLSGHFFTESDILNLFLNAAVIILLSLGEAFVLLIAEIDLSVGSVLALSGVGMAEAFNAGFSAPGAILVAIALGGVVGLFNGVVVAYTRIPSFIVTFASLGAASSIPLVITQAVPIYISAPSFSFIGQETIGPVPLPLVFVAVVFVVLALVLARTVFGSRVYAVGGNREAARLSGIRIRRVVIWCFLVSGLVAGFAGAIEAGRLSSGYPTAGSTTELFDAIAGAVVGGVSLFGGIGTILGALIGAVIVGTLQQGLDVLNVSTYWQPLVVGVVILVGVAVDSVLRSGGLAGLGDLFRSWAALGRGDQTTTGTGGAPVLATSGKVLDSAVGQPGTAGQEPANVAD